MATYIALTAIVLIVTGLVGLVLRDQKRNLGRDWMVEPALDSEGRDLLGIVHAEQVQP